MVGIQCLDHGLAFLKNLLKDLETEDQEMHELEPGSGTSPTLCQRSLSAQKWGFHFDIAELANCLAVLKIHCEEANEFLKYTTSMARVPWSCYLID
jgi:hypothetical protein